MRIVVLLATYCLSMVMEKHQIMRADMAFCAIAAVAFFLLTMLEYVRVYELIPDKDKLRVFLKIIVELIVAYSITACIALIISYFGKWGFFYICRILSGIVLLLGNTTISYRQITVYNRNTKPYTISYEREDFIRDFDEKEFEEFFKELFPDL